MGAAVEEHVASTSYLFVLGIFRNLDKTDFFLLEVVADADVVEIAGHVDETMGHGGALELREDGFCEVGETFVE